MIKYLLLFTCILIGVNCERNTNSRSLDKPILKIPGINELTIKDLFQILKEQRNFKPEEASSRRFSGFNFSILKPIEQTSTDFCSAPVEVFYDKGGNVVRIIIMYQQHFGYEFRIVRVGDGENGLTVFFVKELKSPIVPLERDLNSVVIVYDDVPYFLTLQSSGSEPYTSIYDVSSIFMLDSLLNAKTVLRVREANVVVCGAFTYENCDISAEKMYSLASEVKLSEGARIMALLKQLQAPDVGPFIKQLKVKVGNYAFLPLWTFEDKHSYTKLN